MHLKPSSAAKHAIFMNFLWNEKGKTDAFFNTNSKPDWPKK